MGWHVAGNVTVVNNGGAVDESTDKGKFSKLSDR